MKNLFLAILIFLSAGSYAQNIVPSPNVQGYTVPVVGIIHAYRNHSDTPAWYLNKAECDARYAAAGSSGITSITAGAGLSGGTITTSGTIALKQPFFDTSFSNFFPVARGNMDTAIITMPSNYTHCIVSLSNLTEPTTPLANGDLMITPLWRISGTSLIVYISANNAGSPAPPLDSYLATVHLW